ncbi:MAG TPA: hypothetical protein VF111_13675 [Thermoanaerobaculia bacterium]
MIPRDTSPEAAAVQYAIHRRMTPRERFEAAIEMSDFARELAKAGLRSRHPEMSEEELHFALIKMLYGYERK